MRQRLFALPVALVAIMFLGTGCAGLRLWEKGRYFQTELSPGIKPDQIHNIGVYVYSDGEAVNGTEIPFDVFDLIGDILMFPIKLFSTGAHFNSTQVGLNSKFFTDEIRTGESFEPDTSNSGPSLELATAVQSQLKDLGYGAEIVTDLGHSKEISVEDCLAHAKKAGYDAVFIVHYTGMKSWTEFAGTQITEGYRSTLITTKIKIHNGYLFIPNAALFDTKSGQRLWATSNYGIVEHAHIPNLSGEPFIMVESSALIYNGDDDYFKAAPKAALMIFSPQMWKESFKEFPKRGEKRQKM
jgi:hypothetical protein